MTDKIYKTDYLNYWKRLRKELLPTIIGMTLILIILLISTRQFKNIGFFFFLAYFIFLILLNYLKTRKFIHEIKIIGNKIIIVGHNYNILCEEIFDINETNIEIKVKKDGRTDVGFYLKIISNKKTIDINKTFKWNYLTLIEFYNEFKRIKNEEIDFDQRDLIQFMVKKANGLSNTDIWLGKEIKINNVP